MTIEQVVAICDVAGALIFGFFIGHSSAKGSYRKEAIKRGVAEYYLDENHERQWRWK